MAWPDRCGWLPALNSPAGAWHHVSVQEGGQETRAGFLEEEAVSGPGTLPGWRRRREPLEGALRVQHGLNPGVV